MATLLGYLAQLADTNGNADIADFSRRWEREMAAVERTARRAAVQLGRHPEGAIARVDRSAAGRVAHAAAYWAGTAGEWFDRRRGTRD